MTFKDSSSRGARSAGVSDRASSRLARPLQKRNRSTTELLRLFLFLALRLANELGLRRRLGDRGQRFDRRLDNRLGRGHHADRGVFVVEHRDAVGDLEVANMKTVTDGQLGDIDVD